MRFTVAGIGGLGLAVMYLLDPKGGGRRRKLIRDLGNRARGWAATARTRWQDEVADDRVIEERVRAALGRIVSHPSSVMASSEDGRVTLQGLVPEGEAEALRTGVGRVRGVVAVDDRLVVRERIGST